MRRALGVVIGCVRLNDLLNTGRGGTGSAASGAQGKLLAAVLLNMLDERDRRLVGPTLFFGIMRTQVKYKATISLSTKRAAFHSAAAPCRQHPS